MLSGRKFLSPQQASQSQLFQFSSLQLSIQPCPLESDSNTVRLKLLSLESILPNIKLKFEDTYLETINAAADEKMIKEFREKKNGQVQIRAARKPSFSSI